MKKILLSTAVLTAFSLSIVLFQISCKKSADAAPNTSTGVQQEGKILYSTEEGTKTSTGFPLEKLHIANYDGSNVTDINLALPSGVTLVTGRQGGNLSLSPDHKTIFFEVLIGPSGTTSTFAIYSCNIDGSNPHQISANNKGPYIGVAF